MAGLARRRFLRNFPALATAGAFAYGCSDGSDSNNTNNTSAIVIG